MISKTQVESNERYRLLRASSLISIDKGDKKHADGKFFISNNWKIDMIIKDEHFLLDNIFVGFGNTAYRQVVGIFWHKSYPVKSKRVLLFKTQYNPS